ncbi:MAG: hypothetical protein OCU12_07195 [Methanophagales archaeon]|nr:hypothetical protein [Methanophagales archaeon]
MKVGVRSPDSKIPNLAMMKLAAWHRARGDEVFVNFPLMDNMVDKLYVSYVFTRSIKDHPPNAEVGGTGSGDLKKTLPDAIEHTTPAYDLFGCDYAIGFTSRGCPNKCKFCFVPEKEGGIRAHAEPDEFVLPEQGRVMFLDNNILAAPNCDDVLEWCAASRKQIDFNQGLDARRIDAAVARQLKKIRWWGQIHLACDSAAAKRPLATAVQHMRAAGIGPSRIMVLALIGESGVLSDKDRERVAWLMSIGVDPFAMPFMPPTADMSWQAPPPVRHFARWCNRVEIRKSCSFDEYMVGK